MNNNVPFDLFFFYLSLFPKLHPGIKGNLVDRTITATFIISVVDINDFVTI